jgi:hypothetical protein
MKRNWDTIREILILLEEKADEDYALRLSKFPKDRNSEISYHVELLIEAGLIYGEMSKTIGSEVHDFIITRLTWQGHELLDAIKSDTIWNKTKESFISKGLSMTFDLVKSVAVKIASDYLKINISG